MKSLVDRAGLEGVEIDSAALHTDEIGSDIHRGTRAKLTEKGIAFSPRAAWLFTAAKAREYDYILVMDSYNLADVKSLVYPEDLPKISRLLEVAGVRRDIRDPWYTGNFDETFDDILLGCKALLERIRFRNGL